jgi:hypothetical protein
MAPMLQHFLVVAAADQHLKVLHLLLPAAMAVVDLLLLDGEAYQYYLTLHSLMY